MRKKYRGNRQHFTFRYLLFHHIGVYSSLNMRGHVHSHDIEDDCWKTTDNFFEV